MFSYTNWTYSVVSAVTNVSLGRVRDLLAETRERTGNAHFPSTAAVSASEPLVKYFVKVTNTGTVDSDDVVLGFLVPPNAGKDGVPLQTLFGFERVHVKAGESVTVWLYPALTDFAITDLDGHRAPLPGQYTVRFGVKEAAAHGMGFAEVALTATATDPSLVEAA